MIDSFMLTIVCGFYKQTCIQGKTDDLADSCFFIITVWVCKWCSVEGAG